MNETSTLEKQKLKEIICFYCNDVLMAVDLFKVIEIAHLEKIMRIPHSAYYIEGIVNFRGVVTPIVNLRRRFHYPVFPIEKGANILVYDYDGNNRMAMVIDGIDRVYNVENEIFTKASLLIKKKDEGFVDGYYIIDGKVITVLDIEKIASSKALSMAVSGNDEELSELKKLENEIDDTLNDILNEIPGVEVEEKGIVPELSKLTKQTEDEIYKVTLALEKMLVLVDEQLELAPKISNKLYDVAEKSDKKLLNDFLNISSHMQETIFGSMIHLQFQDIVRQKLEKVLHSIHGITQAIEFNYNK